MTAVVTKIRRRFARPKRPEMWQCACGTWNDPLTRTTCRTCGRAA